MPSTVSRITWLGIVIAYFSITIIVSIFKYFYGPQLTDGIMMARELLIFCVVAFLCFYIIPKEGNKLASIGLHNRNWLKAILWSLGFTVVMVIVLLGFAELCRLLGWSFGESKAFDKLSSFTVTFITIRAGVAEEVFMRGYLLERLTIITGKKWMALLLSSLPFGLLHFTQGIAGIVIATVAGVILSLFYFWKKDLKINIITHFLTDFIPNVLARL